MSMVNELDSKKLFDDCAEIVDPIEGQVVISGLVVCKTAGYYVGRWCAEWMGSMWLPQPYSRESDYFSTVQEAIDAQGQMLADNLELKLSELGELIAD
tara:strand:- start:6 stop:299 length:294 start_codon:yes stop_codon:yes gene_type:complete